MRRGGGTACASSPPQSRAIPFNLLRRLPQGEALGHVCPRRGQIGSSASGGSALKSLSPSPGQRHHLIMIKMSRGPQDQAEATALLLGGVCKTKVPGGRGCAKGGSGGQDSPWSWLAGASLWPRPPRVSVRTSLSVQGHSSRSAAIVTSTQLSQEPSSDKATLAGRGQGLAISLPPSGYASWSGLRWLWRGCGQQPATRVPCLEAQVSRSPGSPQPLVGAPLPHPVLSPAGVSRGQG